MKHSAFVGMGSAPDGHDLPLGFGMHLAQDELAMERFAMLSSHEKEKVIQYIQGCTSGDDAKERIRIVVQGLHEGRTAF